MDLRLSEELEMLRDTARRFAEEHIAPYAQEWDAAAYYPDAIIKKLGDQGFMGILVPEEYGGSAGSATAFAVILEELARHDGGLCLAVEAHNGLCCSHIMIGGNDEQKKRFLPSLAAGDRIGAWCLTEPGSGSDAANLQARAERDGDEYVLNGAKQFITNGERAGTYVILARTSPGHDSKGISAFVVERGTPGLSTGKREAKLGMRSSDTVAVKLEDVRVPVENRLGEEGMAFNDVKQVLAKGRVVISAMSIGFARGAVEVAAKYAKEREAFGHPIFEFQAIQHKLADMATHTEAARLMLYNAVSRLDQGLPVKREAAMTKLFSSEMATRVCMDAIQILGGYGYLCDYNVERYMRDAKLIEIGEGTSEVMRNLIARTL
ncbi:MAG: acyl-CoA dehydrogenase family protein [Candidatus Hydrogenedentes bacterium]|nr:acyl-CoA dehydrogenase family protein [Candidatus Hydrogenedentota bacterium]